MAQRGPVGAYHGRMTTATPDDLDTRVIEPGAPQYNASLVRRDAQHASLATFWVRFDGEPTPFQAGQYMTIGVMVDGRIVQRPYSIASAIRFTPTTFAWPIAAARTSWPALAYRNCGFARSPPRWT